MSITSWLSKRLGLPAVTLMETAGRACAEAALRMIPAGGRVSVICGPAIR